MATRRTIFSQIMCLVDEYEFKKCVDRYKGDRHSIKYSCRDQFRIMSFAQFTDRMSLRDIETTLELCSSDLYHSGLKVMPKSTLAESNEKKDYRIYEGFAQCLIAEAKRLYANDYFRLGLENMVYAFDSSTIELCIKLCPWAKFHHDRGAMKMHTLIDLRGSIPSFVYLTDGRVHDSKVMDKIPVEAGSYYLMDKGYVDFRKLYELFQKKKAYFVTRAKHNAKYEVIEERPVDSKAGLIADKTIRLTGVLTAKKYPDALRLVVYEDFATGNVYEFLTNNFDIEAITVAELYRERWQVELFFKWIKQHLHIKSFYGTTQNAVYTQIWIAVCDYLLLAIAKKKYAIDKTLHAIATSIGTILFKKEDIHDIYSKSNISLNIPESPSPQLTLW